MAAPTPVIVPIALLTLAFTTTPLFVHFLGRNTGWPLSAPYVTATVFEAPAAGAVTAGERPAWSVDWLPAFDTRLVSATDGLGLVLSFIMSLVGVVVFIYSTHYLAAGRDYAFHQVTTTFVPSMQVLVFADGLMLLFIYWELTSLASFLLIASAGNAGEGASTHTLLITFVGGVLFLLAIAAIWWRTGTTSLPGVFSHEVWTSDPGFTALMTVLVAPAGFTGTAQFPFHVWLPDAMIAVTPVSVYLHTAAIIKASTFPLLRFSPVLHANTVWNDLLVTVGLITTCVGGYFVLEQTDVRKLTAYSTVSQFGLLAASIGLSTETGITATVLHTIAHALFKPELFTIVGIIDRSTDTYDLRRFLPGLYRRVPFGSAVMTLGCASMAGTPSMLGFVSKEATLAPLLGAPGVSWVGSAAFLAAVLSPVLAFVYCVRVLLGIFFNGTDKNRPVHTHDPLLAGSAVLPILVFMPLTAWLGGPLGLVASATGAALDGTVPGAHLALWHGPGMELYVTAGILFLGSVIA